MQTETSSAVGAALPADLDYTGLRAAFVRLSPEQILRMLTDLAAGVRARRYPAGRPYRHVNGFTKVVAAEYACGARLTLHYWPEAPGADDDVSRPHDHRFPFASVLLGGAQHFRELVESDDATAERWRRFVYRPFVKGRVAAVSAAGEVGLRQIDTVRRAPLAGHYETSSTGVHQAVTARGSACATLVLRGPRERRTSQVYYRPAEPAPRGGLQLGRRLPHDVVLGQVEHALRMVSGS